LAAYLSHELIEKYKMFSSEGAIICSVDVVIVLSKNELTILIDRSCLCSMKTRINSIKLKKIGEISKYIKFFEKSIVNFLNFFKNKSKFQTFINLFILIFLQ
jgi:hypothetical protein